MIPDKNPAEQMMWTAMTWTWPFYSVGALYVVGPVLAWLLAMLAGLSLYLGPAVRADLRATGPIPTIIWVWMVSMFVMLIALWGGHYTWGLGTGGTIKSSIGWAKGWALMALFPLVGAVLPIRREILIRGQCVVGAWILVLAPLLLIAPSIGLPQKIFVSPLKAVGGPGPEYFSVYLYTIDPSNGAPRWQFYAPWSPFAALLGVIMIMFALEEKNRRWMLAGLGGGVLMILASKSRMGLVGLVACTIGPRMLPLMGKVWAWYVATAVTASLAVFGEALMRGINDGIAQFKGARADSTRVRETLQRIAYERWKNEAPWFGHGRVEPGPHIVEFMPIGSHHTWYGLLFVKGFIGFLALLVPMVWHLALTLTDAVQNPRGRLPMGILMTMVLLSMGENIEIEAYMLWPGLVLLGIHAREMANDRLIPNKTPETP